MKFAIITLLVLVASCSSRNLDPRIVGGDYARENQFPHQIAIFYKNSLRCGGSIINESWVLTAAHCLLGQAGLSICAGTISLNDCKVKRNVIEEFQHEKYGNFMNDIALLRLDRPLEFSDAVMPIEIAKEEIPVNSTVVISGWGRTSSGGPIPVNLKYNSLETLSQDDCARRTGMNFKGLICLAHERGNGACNGDSGGSAMFEDKLVGVANFVIGACGTNNPDGYAKVSYFSDWILQKTSSYEPKFYL